MDDKYSELELLTETVRGLIYGATFRNRKPDYILLSVKDALLLGSVADNPVHRDTRLRSNMYMGLEVVIHEQENLIALGYKIK